ncbi:glycoside hydrolase family 92 protein [Calocera viscosa TUFC12733]|uniref:Glycoside hydrolase family 92 protein n=1 Tax=Calocera viscosa (strain TUFC12733) TaxID=1330018 RepID=A0A167P891_CALVF|nr:glycoside hydrolase family 92 protein [Calocera viscosa TUFC12733]
MPLPLPLPSPRRLLALLLLLLAIAPASAQQPQTPLGPHIPSNLDYVNPLIGTAGWSQTEYGGMIPHPGPPFAMTQFTPMTQEPRISRRAYHHTSPLLHGFLATHQPAIWMGDSGYVSLSPGLGSIKALFEDRGMPFTHEGERARVGEYCVVLDAGGGRTVRARLAARSRTGVMRFNLPWVLVQATRAGVRGHISIHPHSREISGYNPDRQDSHLGPYKATGFKGFFVARFSERFSSWGTAVGGEVHEGRTHHTSEHVSAWVRFGEGVREVQVTLGVSFVSVEQARRNLEEECPDAWGVEALERVVRRTRAEWEEKLGRVNVQGAGREMLEVFYTGMYHALQYPSEMSESGAYYSGFTDSVHRGEAAYTAYSTWDIFRAEWAFLLLFAPERAGGMVRSMLQSYREGGWLPIWMNVVETNIMVGTHADSMIAEAMVKGVGGFDEQLVWEAVWKNAMVPPEKDLNITFYDREPGTPVEARAGLCVTTYYKKNGWVAADRTAEAGSRTLDYAYDDYAASVVAELTGHAEDAAHLRERSKNYRHVFRDATGFMNARNLDGSWAADWAGWTEGDKWKYTFGVMHDIPGLIELMGRDRFLELLTAYWVGGHNQHDNEPSHHVPYLYAYLGGNMTSRTQRLVRQVAREEYAARPDGLSGNEDCGQMSAWYIFSALGFYPVSPASGEYVVGSPFFERVVLRLPGPRAGEEGDRERELIISAPGASWKPYVRELYIDGRRVDRPFVKHSELWSARVVRFEMSEVPVAWG